jgi:hypothetical protein
MSVLPKRNDRQTSACGANTGVKPMTKFVNVSNLTRLAVILAAGIAVMATADIANAERRHDNNGENHVENSDRTMHTWQLTGDHKDKKKKHESANKKNCYVYFAAGADNCRDQQKPVKTKRDQKPVETKKDCKYVTADGKTCGQKPVATTQPTPKPVATTPTGSTTPTGASTTTSSNLGGNVAHGTTISNGVNKIILADSPQGLTVYSKAPGTITVFNGFTEQTFKGGSVTLNGVGVASGATNVQTLGLQSIKLPNGDYSIAIP